ncbi:Rrf2 family transcriptional regulator [Planctomycetota bacterium]|nr:Rrf2 family transcriptional regulator [Planctomycetota bacterium]
MIYSNACAYAIRAMTRLAMLRPDGYVLLDELCEGSDLPRHFVAKIFQDLVRKGLLTSAKGRGGGFALARRPHEIRLLDIMEVVDGTRGLEKCVVGMAECNSEQPCPLHDKWAPIRDELNEFLEGTMLDQMSETLLRKLELLGTPVPSLTRESKPIKREDEAPNAAPEAPLTPPTFE